MKVFLSSTYIDLVEHRKAVIEALERLGQQVERMEVFGARPEEPTAACLSEIDECELFVGIYAHRYGHIPEGSEYSITEQELLHAMRTDKKLFCFIVDDNHAWAPKMVDGEPNVGRLRALKEKISKNVVKDTFTSPNDLALKVATSVGRYLSNASIGNAQQAAAVCYRKTRDELEFLLIRTSGRRWMFPKGTARTQEPLWKAAEREAFEEAGVSGEIRQTPLTSFLHLKRELKQTGRELRVVAFLLKVENQIVPLEQHRSPTWFSLPEAEEALARGRDFKYAAELMNVIRTACVATQSED
jgi:8-oxo-dGTP pyrophosphatase MutT (NUDIX family)